MKPSDMVYCGKFAAARLQEYGFCEEAAALNNVIGLYESGMATYESLSEETTCAWLIAKAHERGALHENAVA